MLREWSGVSSLKTKSVCAVEQAQGGFNCLRLCLRDSSGFWEKQQRKMPLQLLRWLPAAAKGFSAGTARPDIQTHKRTRIINKTSQEDTALACDKAHPAGVHTVGCLQKTGVGVLRGSLGSMQGSKDVPGRTFL